MSDIMLRTLNMAADAIAGKQILPNLDLKQLIAAISNDKEKHDAVVVRFVNGIGKHFHSATNTQKRKHLITLVYCCQLESTFTSEVKEALSSTAKHVITFIEQAKLVFDKKIGYLCLSSLTNSCTHDIAYLSVNTIMKDIASKDEHVIKIALQAVPHLMLVDLVPVLFPIVEKRLSHTCSSVKSQAIIAMATMYKTAPEFVINTKHHVKFLLADRDPVVMAAALPYVCQVLMRNTEDYPKMCGKLLFILKQVVSGNLPLSMTSHGIAAPWIQIRILKIMPKLKFDEEQLKEMADAFHHILNRSQNSSHLIAFAVAYQCICAIIQLMTSTDVVFLQALSHLSTFVHSTNPNLLLAGLELLTKISLIDPLLCNSYQDKIVKCLGHSDLSIQKQTLILLESLMNQENYQAVSHHMISQLAKSHWSSHFVKTSSEKISSLATKFSNDDKWLLDTIHLILASSGSNASELLFPKVIACVSKASKEVQQRELRRCAGLKKLSFLHFRIIAWEFAYLAKHCENANIQNITEILLHQCSLLDKGKCFQQCLLTTIHTVTKLIAICPVASEGVMQNLYNVAGDLTQTSCTVNQKLQELKILSENQKILKLISDLDKFELESDMNFLDDLISQSRERHKNVIITMTPKTSTTENFSSQIKISVKQKQHQVKSSASFLASTLPQESDKMQESFLGKSLSATEQPAKLWGKQGFLGSKKEPKSTAEVEGGGLSTSLLSSPSTTISSNPPTLNEALQNLTVIDESSKEDRAMLDMMNDMLMTSQSDSDVIASPFRFPEGNS